MKKFLLSIVVALAAVSVNAQKANVKGMTLNTKKFNTEQRVKSTINLAPVKAEMLNANSGKKTILKRATEDSEVFAFLMQTYAGENVPEFTFALPDTLWKANQTVQVVIDEQGNTEDVQCNVCLKRNFGGYRVTEPFYGVYTEDENGASLWFPEQIGIKADGVSSSEVEYHYDIYFYNIDLTEDGKEIEGVYSLSFEGDGDGVLFSSHDGWGLYYVDRTSGEDLGWGAFVWDPILYTVNGTASCYTSRQGARTDYNWGAYIEDLETQVAVYGWLNTKVVMSIEDDLKVKMKAKFPVADEVLATADGDLWDAGRILGYNWTVDDEGYIRSLDDDDYIEGVLSGNTIVIPGIYTHSEVGGTGDYEGYYYGINFYRENTFMLNEGSYAAGISDVNMSREDLIKNTKTYNLMGQQVDRKSTKGLLIRNGKKFINK